MLFRPLILAAALMAPSLVIAQESVRVRGTVEAVDGSVITLATEAGETTSVTMNDDYLVFVYVPITAADLKPNDFLSIPSITGADGSKVALSINVFAEAFRGLNEGVNPWDMEDGSLMTNATIGTVEETPEGNILKVTYEDTQEDIVVLDETPITRFAPEEGRTLEIGDRTIIFATQADDGTVVSGAAGVMQDGTLPPV